MNCFRLNKLFWLVLGFAAVGLSSSWVSAASVKCMFGTTRCIKSQGTEIPAKDVIEILDWCETFTFRDIGSKAMRLSHEEAYRLSGGSLTPLLKAWHVYGDLIDSPLKFERKSKAEETRYREIKSACYTLRSDYYNDSKWKR